MSTNKLKIYRESKDITQKQLGEILGVTNDYISILERGKQTPSLSFAKRLADFFETTIESIFFNN